MKNSIYEKSFNPLNWWRPSKIDRVRYFIAIGDSGVGKTTLFRKGWRELAENQIYNPDDLNVLDGVEFTQNFCRFSIPRRKYGIRIVDSWIDGDGETFQAFFGKAFQLGNGNNLPQVTKAIRKAKSSITVVIPACVLEWDLDALDKEAAPILCMINQFVASPGFLTRRGKCNLIITQSEDTIPLNDHSIQEEFKNKLRRLLEKTSMEHYCEHALLVESLPTNPDQICKISKTDRQITLSKPDAIMCSAGTALAVIMGIVPKKDANGWGFAVSTKKS